MKLKTSLEFLEKLNFIDDSTTIAVVVNKGNRLRKADELFCVNIRVKEAKQFFGDLEILINRIANDPTASYHISRFEFLLAYEADD